jgi:Kef-type K+ transport system membrane component KefB
MEVLFSISLALVAGLLISRVVKPLKLPAVTGYLIAGILIGPYCLGHLNLPDGFDVIGMLPGEIQHIENAFDASDLF